MLEAIEVAEKIVRLCWAETFARSPGWVGPVKVPQDWYMDDAGGGPCGGMREGELLGL
jgi:hypothetical protein